MFGIAFDVKSSEFKESQLNALSNVAILIITTISIARIHPLTSDISLQVSTGQTTVSWVGRSQETVEMPREINEKGG